MDQRAWQKIISFDLLHSSYMCLQTILSRGKHCKTMQIGSVSRLRFCRRSLRIQILHQVEHCAFSEVTRLFPISWMCKKQTSVSHSSTESEIISVGCRIKDGWYTRTWFVRFDRHSSSREHASEWSSMGRPVHDKFVVDDDMDSGTATESNFSLRSRSFLNRVNDRLRKMLDRSPEDVMQDIDKRSLIWWMFLCST